MEKQAVSHHGAGLRVAIVSARSNEAVVSKLVQGTKKALMTHGVKSSDLTCVHVTRPAELAFAATLLLDAAPDLDAVICIGCLVHTDVAPHAEVESHATARAIMSLNTSGSDVPVVYAVLTCVNAHQARDFVDKRSAVDADHGNEWAKVAIDLARVSHSLA
ncbi:TPA: hypothetical protein N0F65_008870 [Lagenidium giganteum]|uniref:6,7-dimethyl-8-ribityllumazine synthase n=1 Tax=Lagenidium giganteum TaxID=4803 RepID=A0AAV2YKR9_9STRA|nr:TPA: hypothetical protein N0F65_008870 [Lagenidium giganteum]